MRKYLKLCFCSLCAGPWVIPALFLTCLPISLLSQTTREIIEYQAKANLYKNKNQFDSSMYFYGMLDEIFKASGNQREKIKNQLELTDLLIQKRDFKGAYHNIKIFENEIRNSFSEDWDLKSNFLQIKGSYFLASGDLDSSKFYLVNSIKLRIEFSNQQDTLLYYAWNKLGNYHLARGDYSNATSCYQNSNLLASQKKNPNNYLLASSLQNLGIAAVISGDFFMAEDYFLNSLALNEKLFNPTDPPLASIYINIGKFYNDLSKYDLALSYFDKAEMVLLNTSVDLQFNRFVSLYWNIGNLYTLKGEYEKAISYLQKTYNLLENTNNINNQQIQAILMDIGFVYEKKKNLRLAIDYYIKSTQNQELPSIVKSYRNLGRSFTQLNVLDSGNYYFKLSIINTKKFFGQESYDMALCYQYYGELLAKFNKDSALYFYNKSLDILKILFDEENRDIAKIRLLIGEYYLSNQQPDKALSSIRTALKIFIPDLGIKKKPEELIQAIHPDLILPEGLNLQARALLNKYHDIKKQEILEESLFNLRLSNMVIEMIRETFDDEESQFILNNNARATVDLGVRVSFELFQATGDLQYLSEAFQFSEKGKAIILLGALRGLEAESSSIIPLEKKEREEFIAKEMATYNNFVYNESKKKSPDSLKLRLWNEKLFMLRQSFDSLITSFRRSYPEYFRLKYDYSVIQADSVASLLAADQALLAFHLADSTAYGFAFSGNEHSLKELCPTVKLTAKLDSLQKLFSFRGYVNSGIEEFRLLTRLSSELYTLLIHPFEEFILEKRLIIIPDGELGLLGFDILLKELPGLHVENYKDLDWLVRHHPISYSSSATIYFGQYHLGHKENRKKKNLLAFAPSYNYPSDHRGGSMTDSVLLNLSSLKGAREEIVKISKVLHIKKLFDDKASEDNFKELAGNYNILHLAMHTLIDNQKPLYSKLVFSFPEANSPEDGYLNTYELFNLDLKGELAVLSACNTGSGKLERGEGIISLARGFFYAGIPSVVMTLWEVEDYTSADILPVFYKNLIKGLPKDIALQQAKLNYLENAGKLQSHPYFWAAFINHGQPDPVNFGKNTGGQKFTIISFILIMVLFSIYFFINKRVFFNRKGH